MSRRDDIEEEPRHLDPFDPKIPPGKVEILESQNVPLEPHTDCWQALRRRMRQVGPEPDEAHNSAPPREDSSGSRTGPAFQGYTPPTLKRGR